MDQLAVLMLADEHVGSCAPVPDRYHELTPVPEGEDQPPPFPVQRVDMFRAAVLETEHPPEQPNKHRADRGEQ